MDDSPYPEGAGVFFFGPLIGVAMWGMAACAWEPIVHRYPSGLVIVRGDQTLVAQACGTGLDDKGQPRDPRKTVGCYDKSADTIYVRNTNEGAKALTHELAHREGVADPKAGGFDW